VTGGRNIFALPAASPARTATILAAFDYVSDAHDRHMDARDVLKGLEAQHGAKLTYPTYRTALRCGDIYSEAATSCALSTAKILIDSFMLKAHRYLASMQAGDRPAPAAWRFA